MSDPALSKTASQEPRTQSGDRKHGFANGGMGSIENDGVNQGSGAGNPANTGLL
jgi:hypothetical protein